MFKKEKKLIEKVCKMQERNNFLWKSGLDIYNVCEVIKKINRHISDWGFLV